MENKDIGKILRNRRISLRLTMKQVAEKCFVSEATVSRWETGEIKNIKRGSIYLLSEALYLPIETILGIDSNVEIVPSVLILKRKEIYNLIEKIKNVKDLNKIEKFIKDFIIEENNS